jgi:hypothetical protein
MRGAEVNGEERLLRAIFEAPEDRAAREAAEAAAEALLRAKRARKALAFAPELAAHLRSLLTPSDGRTERGELPELRTPLLTGVADAADELLARLLEWATWWAGELRVDLPVAWSFAKRNYQDAHPSAGYRDVDAQGYRANVDARTAAAIMRSLVIWLIQHEEAIADHPRAGDYQDDVSALVWSLRAASGLVPDRPMREPSPRPCPVCGELAMRAEYFGSPFQAAVLRGERLSPAPSVDETEEQATNRFMRAVDGIEVRCEYCGHVEAASATRIARWLS